MHGMWFFPACFLLVATYVIAGCVAHWADFDEDSADWIAKETAQFLIAWYMGDFE